MRMRLPERVAENAIRVSVERYSSGRDEVSYLSDGVRSLSSPRAEPRQLDVLGAVASLAEMARPLLGPRAGASYRARRCSAARTRSTGEPFPAKLGDRAQYVELPGARPRGATQRPELHRSGTRLHLGHSK